jgi:hypothetical protein
MARSAGFVIPSERSESRDLLFEFVFMDGALLATTPRKCFVEPNLLHPDPSHIAD